MRKIYLFTLCLFTTQLLFSACQLSAAASREEEIRVELPQWPPADAFSENYPALSRWKIVITKAASVTTCYTTDTSIEISVGKNEPVSVLAYPITLLEDSEECSYFKPAGFFYPWSAEVSNALSWEQGFLADAMAKFFCNAIESCNSPQDSSWAVRTFNWSKAQEVIDKKLAEPQELFYNPWFINYATFLDNLAASQFRQSLLNTSSCYAFSVESYSSDQQSPLLSSFIPENRFLNENRQITVKKGLPHLISTVKKYGILVTFNSSKNISLEFIYLPIYIEDI